MRNGAISQSAQRQDPAMKSARLLFSALLALGMAAASPAVLAYDRYHHGHGGRVHFGITLGAPLWYPGPYYYPPYPYYPPAVIGPPAPRVYIERDDQAAAPAPPPAQQYWYYCRDSDTYYPYVKECASPWERVPAHPPTQ